MSTVTKQSPMNLESNNDTDTGIDALSRTGLETALEIAIRLQDQVHLSFVNKSLPPVTISIGIK